MRAGEVLDAQGDLLERLGDPLFRKIIGRLAEYEFGRSGGYRQDQSTPLPEILTTGLKAAYAYRVTHDMSMLVEHAAHGLEDLDRFDHSLAPTGCGFVSFDRPLPLLDQRGMTMLVHYLIWGPIGVTGLSEPATLMVAFNDLWRQPDEVQADMLPRLKEAFLADGHSEQVADEQIEATELALGRWATVGATAFLDGMRLGPMLKMPDAAAQAKIIAEGDTPHEGMSAIRYLHALWLMMEQTIAKVEPEEADRPSRRRAVRRKIPGKVTVIRLRREASSENRGQGESMVEWAHRWVVRGYWRTQPVGENHPLAQEVEPGVFKARIWVHGHTKGPLDKPFHQTEKVYSLER